MQERAQNVEGCREEKHGGDEAVQGARTIEATKRKRRPSSPLLADASEDEGRRPTARLAAPRAGLLPLRPLDLLFPPIFSRGLRTLTETLFESNLTSTFSGTIRGTFPTRLYW